ncbi:MAG TPA: sulfatase [Planctomycetota bacterium]|nr:sulfatase [Planctomycetota bacterium]
MSRSSRAAAPGQLRRAPLLAALLVAAALTGTSGCGGRAAPLTILLISLDTTRPDHLSAYGYDRETTPTLARLAREGARFTNARSTTSWTLPSHMSLFTGLPPGLHEVVIDFQSLDRGRRTLGEIFQGAGFRTAGVFSAPYVHGKYGFGRGMEYYERGTLEPMALDLPPAQQRLQLGRREQIGHHEVTSERVTDRGLNLLDLLDAPRVLCFLHYFDAHYDYLAPAPITARFIDRGYAGPVTGEDADTVASTLGEHPAAADLAQLQGYYDAELAWIDQNLERLLARQEQRGELDDTLIVVTGDHGEAFFEHGRFGHRFDLHDEVLRIPLIVWAPGRVPAGQVIEESVSIVDVLPTLMDYAGIAPDPSLDGRSLRPLIDGGRLPPRPVTAALSFFPPPPAQGHYRLHEAIVKEGMKLVRRVDVPWTPERQQDIGEPPMPGSERLEVFDLVADPDEQRNLVGTGDPRVGPLTEAFEAERERQREKLATFRPQGSGGPITDMSLFEIMRQNGYF